MNTRRNFNIKLSALAVMTALAIPLGNATAADPMVLRSGNVDSFAQSYGRAGGLVGSDRVMALHGTTADNHAVGMVFDHDVATRTNMSLDRSTSGQVGISYDEDVAVRTNNARTRAPVQSLETVSLVR